MAVEEPLKKAYQNIHQGYQTETLVCFLKAREWNVAKAHKMKPIVPTKLYSAVCDSQLVGMSGYSREVLMLCLNLSCLWSNIPSLYHLSQIVLLQGLPVFALGVGFSTFDRASVWDMTGLKLSALSRIKVVKPLLQERTRKKIQVLSGNGQDELLKIMDFASLPHFCKREGSGPSRHSENGRDHCFSLNHPFHQQLYGYVKQQALSNESAVPVKQGSLHVDLPEPAAEGMEIAKTIESEFR